MKLESFVITSLLSLGMGVSLRGQNADPLESVGKTSRDWVQTRAETVREQKSWQIEQELLASTTKALEDRAQALDEKKESFRARHASELEETKQLEAKILAGGEQLKKAEETLRKIDKNLVALRPSLPPRLAAALELPFLSLAKDELPVSERLQHTLTILNRCAQFNRIITATEEVLSIETGSPKNYEVLYWGLSHGYALDRRGNKLWLGRPGAQGWQWENLPKGQEAVATLIAIQAGKADPDFVEVPARLSSSTNPQR